MSGTLAYNMRPQSLLDILGQKHIFGENGLFTKFVEKNDDNEEIVDKMINKLINLRIFEDENEKLNLSLMDIKGEILSISQFTLYANCKKGRRPSFLDAAKPEISKPLYEYFNKALENAGVHTETGIFGAMMKVSLINDGPTTIILDSKEII